MSDNVKRRSIPFKPQYTVTRRGENTVLGQVIVPTPIVVPGIVGKQETVSHDNPGFLAMRQLRRKYRKKIRPSLWAVLENQDYGSSFQTVSHEYDDVGAEPITRTGFGSVNWLYTNFNAPAYAKGVATTGDSTLWPSLPFKSTAVLQAWGTKAIAQTIPGSPSVDLGVALAELYREGIPALPGKSLFEKSLSVPKKGSQEYLNWQFGWKPILSSVHDFIDTTSNHRKLVAKYLKHADRHLKRRWTFPDIVTTEFTIDSPGTYPYPVLSGNYPSSGVRTRERVTTTRMWFSGDYTYHVPTDDQLLGKYRRWEHIAQELYGTRVTPETLWNLTPWSWLSDWALNVGDITHNLSVLAFQDVIMTYGYIMCETRIEDTYVLRGNFGSLAPPVLTQTFATVTKQRLKATPFGFGLTYDGLSSTQQAILAALGISKSPTTRIRR